MAGKAEIARKNGRKGGRPKGRKNDKTLEKESVATALQQRVLSIADRLLDKELQLAMGQMYLYKIEKYYEGKKLKRKKPKLVTEEYEIAAWLEKYVNGEVELNTDPAATYYFFVVRDPNIGALRGLRELAIGKQVQPISFDDSEGKSIFQPDEKEKTDKAIKHFLK